MESIDYTSVTEMTGYNVTQEQLKRMYTRYRFAAGFSKGKEVLEVACGSGQGLGYLARSAKKVTGGDYDEKLLACARSYYQDRIEIIKLDAQNLPFEDNSFDVVVFYEAIYYLKNPEKFLEEAYRVLRKDGILLICSANKEWQGFNPSPYSHRYFSASELSGLLKAHNFLNVTAYGDCPEERKTVKDKILGLAKKTAVALHIIPKTMKGKEFLKKFFYGKLSPLPPEINDEVGPYEEPVAIPVEEPDYKHKVIFAIGYK